VYLDPLNKIIAEQFLSFLAVLPIKALTCLKVVQFSLYLIIV